MIDEWNMLREGRTPDEMERDLAKARKQSYEDWKAAKKTLPIKRSILRKALEECDER